MIHGIARTEPVVDVPERLHCVVDVLPGCRCAEHEPREGEDEGGLRNVFYQVMVDFTQNTGRTEDDPHGDDLMKYGHLGRFNVYQQNSYQYDPGADVFRWRPLSAESLQRKTSGC